MITFRIGQPSNIPWWRCLNMSDEEIKKFNDQWMVEMTTDESTNIERVKSKDFDIIWNAAIEACAFIIDNVGAIDGKTLRELKK